MEDEMEMDSLFEGMVLFDPNSSFLEQQQQQQQEPEEKTCPPIESDHSQTQSQNEPLDESLFSDLTLVSQLDSDPPPQLHPPTPSSLSLSRHLSKKKKRSAGLRIGYARDPNDDEAQAQAQAQSQPQAQAQAQAQAHDGPALPSTSNTAAPPPSSSPSPSPSPPDDSDSYDIEELRLLQIKAQISQKLSQVRQLAAAVSSARNDAIAKRRQASESLHTASNAYADLETQLNEACKSEDFETAERLSQTLAEADDRMRSLLAALADAESHCDAIESRMNEVLASQIAAEEDCASMLHQLAKDASNKADLALKTAKEWSSKQLDEWLCSTESLELKKMELEIESHIVDEARNVLNANIESSVEDDKKERESLCEKKSVLIDELEELLALVKRKEQEIAETEANIEAVENRIANVVSGFQETRLDIESKFGDLQSCISNVELESEALSKKKREIDDFLAKEEEKGEKLRELANSSAEEAKTYQEVVELRKNLMMFVLKSREDKVRLAKTEKELSDDVRMLQQEVSNSRSSLQELSTRKSSIQQDISSSKQKIIFIDKRVPELEVEKKVAATARNFKEAARIAAESKSLTVEKNDIQSVLERAVLELEKLEREITDTVEEIQETEVVISSKEKEVAMARYERLLLTAGYAAAERAAALEIGDVEEANLLLAEAEAADSEAKELQSIYNFKVEEFANIPKHFISMELVANLGKNQLAELAASVGISPA